MYLNDDDDLEYMRYFVVVLSANYFSDKQCRKELSKAYTSWLAKRERCQFVVIRLCYKVGNGNVRRFGGSEEDWGLLEAHAQDTTYKQAILHLKQHCTKKNQKPNKYMFDLYPKETLRESAKVAKKLASLCGLA